MGGLLSELDRFQMTHWRPGKGQMSPELLAQEAAKQREQALYAQPTDPTIAGYSVSEKLPPHLRPAWRGMGLLGEALAPSAMKENPGTVGLLTDVASSVPGTKGILAMAALPGSMKGIRAFHGSPHSFDRFDLSKIGTGEGAQAYGHGLYFAENEGVARSYRDALAPLAATPGSMQEAALMKIRGHGGREDAIDFMRTYFPKELASATDNYHKQLLREIENTNIPGHMYEVNINAHPDEFLDWDKPLSGQLPVIEALRGSRSPKIREIAKDEGLLAPTRELYGRDLGPYTGEDLYKRVALAADGKVISPAATPLLKNAGVPGIKYLDQGSRASGDGSRNYVVFDDKLIDIMRKYGIGPFAVGGAMAMTGGDQP